MSGKACLAGGMLSNKERLCLRSRTAGRYSRRPQVQDQDAVRVHLGVVEADGPGQIDPEFFSQPECPNDLPAVPPARAHWKGVPHRWRGRLDADAAVRLVVQQ